MPGLDRTGPEGLGPRTGGARGLCGGVPVNSGFFGRGGGYARRGRGGGLGRRLGADYASYPENSVSREAFLKAETVHLKNRLDFIQKELDNITVDKEKDDNES